MSLQQHKRCHDDSSMATIFHIMMLVIAIIVITTTLQIMATAQYYPTVDYLRLLTTTASNDGFQMGRVDNDRRTDALIMGDFNCDGYDDLVVSAGSRI